MNLKNTFLTLLLAISLWPDASVAQQSSDAELMTKRYSDSYDSLLNSYYLRRYAHHRLQRTRELSLDEFDALPDSLIASRLAALRTVIPMTFNQEVRSHIRYYLKVMSTRLDVMLMLCEYYHPMFEEALDRYDVPEEVKYLAIVESAMNPQATSRVGAAGLWQFMYSTGKRYGLEVNSIIDDRRDPYKSTEAAALYLHDLHRIFNDWTLAIAAYNCGPGNINKAIARSGGKRNFWDIYNFLPRETRGYIPAFIAANYVMNYYSEHGLRPAKLTLPVRADTLMLGTDVFLCFVEEIVGVDHDELVSLNPQYRIGFIPASTGNYTLSLPSNAIERFIRLQDSIYDRTADSLSRRPVNVQPYKKGTSRKATVAKNKKKKGGASRYHTVRKGETLYSVATKNGTTVQKLRKLNGLKSDKIRAGQKIRVR